MAQDSTSTFTFSPRPEAHPMNWADLLSPVRHAVRDLLLRIDGATTQQEGKAGEVAASCFLVYGDRGTGKSTVLLSVKKACNPNPKIRDDFFKEPEQAYFGKYDDREKKMRDEAKTSAEKLHNVVWLEVLDLEPLPPRANLLTTVLTRVRNALDSSGAKKSSDETTSILEEGVDSARHKLKQLINDATLMWEDINEPDTRTRANRQIAAADIYAQFQERFKDAMDTLSLELGRRSGKGDTHSAIVLPIDNIDRSTEHLYSIVKLAQMVSCSHFWLVMAGDRQDVDTFLERAYWKELIRIGESAGATGKEGVSGEDEALVMARRQAAAASHRLLPPSHRVEVGLVPPEETLEFKPLGMSRQAGTDKSIRDLLAEVRLIKKEEEIPVQKKAENTPENKIEKDHTKIRFIHLFDAQDLIPHHLKLCLRSVASTKDLVDEGRNLIIVALVNSSLHIRIIDVSGRRVIDKPESQLVSGKTLTALKEQLNPLPDESRLSHEHKQEIIRNGISIAGVTSYYTEAGNLGLRLPARGVLDLWQLAYWMTNECPTHLQAEKIARTMLRNVIAESSMPSEMSQYLQERIIRRNPQRGTRLDFWSPDPSLRSRLQMTRLESTDYIFHPSMKVRKTAAKYWLSVVQTQGMMLSLQGVRPSLAGGVNGGVNGYPVTLSLQGVQPSSDALLPDLVAAWLSILYDAIQWGVEDSAVITSPRLSPSIIVRCQHEAIESEAEWPWPQWMSFISHDVHGQLWSRFLRYLKAPTLLEQASLEGSLPRLLVTGWIACVVETFLASAPQRKWEGAYGILKQLEDDISCGEHCGKEGMAGAIKKAEETVMKAAAGVYAKILALSGGGIYSTDDETIPLLLWFETGLPLLLSYWWVPMADGGAKTRAEEIIDFLKRTELAKFWKDGWPNFLDYIEKSYNVPFDKEPFNDLHKLWPNPRSTQIRKKRSSGAVRNGQSTGG